MFVRRELICTPLVRRDGLQAAAIAIQIARFPFTLRRVRLPAASLLFPWRWALAVGLSEATLGMKTSTVTRRAALSRVIFRPFGRELPARVSI